MISYEITDMFDAGGPDFVEICIKFDYQPLAPQTDDCPETPEDIEITKVYQWGDASCMLEEITETNEELLDAITQRCWEYISELKSYGPLGG